MRMLTQRVLLTERQQSALREAALKGPAEIEAVTARLRQENPRAFHTPDTLQSRQFVLDPVRDLPCRRVSASVPDFDVASLALFAEHPTLSSTQDWSARGPRLEANQMRIA